MTSRTELKLAPGLALPLDAVTQTIAIVAKRRAGKSYLARRLAEQLAGAGQQLVIVDPKGDWWGIRSAADGKAPGLPIVILGGERGDVPLEAGAGELVAKLVVEERVSALLDLSLLRKHEVATFMTGFLEAIYRLKAREQYRTPVMLVIDEADAVAPQKPQPNEARMLGAAEDIVRRGGQRGIGCLLITQRTAVLNKNVLTQAQILIALRTIAPQDLKAMNAWIDVHGEDEQRRTLMASLPSLPVGDAWVWSPGWPTNEGIFERIHTMPIETFDSGASPKPGEKRIEPKRVADVDLEALRRQMADTLERAKADDPKALRARIAELEKAAKGKAPPAPKEKRVEVPVLKANELRVLTRVANALESVRGAFSRVEACEQRLTEIRAAVAARTAPPPPSAPPQVMRTVNFTPTPELKHAARAAAPRVNGAAQGSKLGAGERRTLTAIAMHTDGCSPEQLTVLTGYKRSSRNTFTQKLTAAGLIARSGERFLATDAGVAELGAGFEPLPTGDALRAHWLAELGGGGERRILELLCDAFPEPMAREDLDEPTGYTRSSRNTFIQKLIARRLVDEVARGQVRASGALFG